MLCGLLCFVTLVGCASDAQEQRQPGSRARDQLAAAISEPLDLGQDWDAKMVTLTDPLSEPAPGQVTAGGPVWGIVLKTFSDENHQQQAAIMIAQLKQLDPELGSSWVQTKESGSIVAYGRYQGPDDPRARRDLQWIKDLNVNGRRVFPRAMLARLQRGSGGTGSPYQLMSVRRQYPDIDPLYTLQVGVWGSFGGAVAWTEAQRRAEADVARLRGEGVPAYVHHDPNAELSMVTVGLFDHRALNPRSGLFSSEVEALLRRYPEHLVNGQPVTDPGSKRSQAPNLVLVPKK